MVFLIAPDSFKGSLSAVDAARAMSQGVRSVAPDATVIELPVADGGEGTVEVLVAATRGRIVETTVTGPLGRPVRAAWGILGDEKTAVIEMAAASGLMLLRHEERNPRKATTFGTGELIRAALDCGARKIIVGIGGSASNDGGAGLAEALGVRLLDRTNRPLARGGEGLSGLSRIDVRGLDLRLRNVEIVAACDVENVLCGPKGASAVYGPQKGATAGDVKLLDGALHRYGKLIARTFGIDVLMMRRGGAGGGLGAGLSVFCDARLQSGIDIVLDAIEFDRHTKNADVILTGEGRIDSQLQYGKALAGILGRASGFKVPVLGVAGVVEGSRESFCGKGMFKDLLSMADETTSIESSMRNPGEVLGTRTSELVTRWMRGLAVSVRT